MQQTHLFQSVILPNTPELDITDPIEPSILLSTPSDRTSEEVGWSKSMMITSRTKNGSELSGEKD